MRTDDILALSIAAGTDLYVESNEDVYEDRLLPEQLLADALACIGRIAEAEALHDTPNQSRIAHVLFAIAAAATKAVEAKASATAVASASLWSAL